MLVSYIVAVDRNGLLGDDRGMPWHLPGDLKRFRSLTMGKPLIMGRKTHELIGRVLPGRDNIVITRQPSYLAPGCLVVHSLAEALRVGAWQLEPATGGEIMIIGGGQIYREAIHLWDKLYLTVVEGNFSGTAFFPLDDLFRQGGCLLHEEAVPVDEHNPHPHTFYVIKRDRSADRELAPALPDSRIRELGTQKQLPVDLSVMFPRCPDKETKEPWSNERT
jgi:dihydrofolate reductase